MKATTMISVAAIAFVPTMLGLATAEEAPPGGVHVDKTSVTMDNGYLKLTYDLSQGKFSVMARGLGTVLQNGKVIV